MATTRPLEAKAAHLKAQLDAISEVESLLDSLREALAAFPELRADFSQELMLLANPVPDADASTEEEHEETNKEEEEEAGEERDEGDSLEDASDTEGQGNKPSAAERLIAYFREHDNEPTTANELAEATGLRLGTIQSVIYKPSRNKGRFVPANITDGAFWQLADTLADELWDKKTSGFKKLGAVG